MNFWPRGRRFYFFFASGSLTSEILAVLMNYQRAGVASTFSPTFSAVLAEARAFASLRGAELEIIHAAAREAEKEKRFQAELPDSRIRWVEGIPPATAILSAVEEHGYDLLIAGALKSEQHENPFTNGVARELLRQAPCDLLLLPHPREEPPPMRHLAFSFDPGVECADFILNVVRSLRPERVTLTTTDTPFAAALASLRGEEPQDVEAWLAKSLSGLENENLELESRVVASNTGYNLCDVVQGLEADLLVVRASEEGESAPMPKHMNWLYQVIPTRLLVVRD